MIRDYFSLAVQNLKHRGLRSWLTMLGIFIGIATIVALISLGQGLQSAVTAQFSSLSADTLVIQNAQTSFGPPGSTAITKLTDHDVQLIANVPGVSMVIPRLLRVLKMEYNKKAQFQFVVTIPDDQAKVDVINSIMDLRPDKGRLLRAGDAGKVVLGSSFTDDSFGRSITVGRHVTLQGTDFEVVGILKPAGSFQINQAILMSERDLKQLLDLDDEFDLIVARVQNKNNVEMVAKSIEEKLRRDRNEKPDEEDFTVQTPIQALSTINTVLTVINVIVVGIAFISLIVGGVGIMNTMYTSVLERTKEIGVMKAVGARNSRVLLIFVIESGLLGLVGGIIGSAMGLFIAFGISSLAAKALGSNLLAITISWPLVFGVILFSFLIGVLSGLLPSLQAARLKPVEAFRR